VTVEDGGFIVRTYGPGPGITPDESLLEDLLLELKA